jgi:hypothetical protein
MMATAAAPNVCHYHDPEHVNESGHARLPVGLVLAAASARRVSVRWPGAQGEGAERAPRGLGSCQARAARRACNGPGREN